MAISIVTLAVVYVLGLLTSFFLVASLIYSFTSAQQDKDATEVLPEQEKGRDYLDDESKRSALLKASREDDVAAGYFAVCREYVPGGVNATPSSRKLAGQEGASVYQNLYRNIRKKGETSQEPGLLIKAAENVFFVVIRHGHLMLFDNAEQIEVRQVIPLASFDILVRGDDDLVPEGELWIKRNCICLSRKPSASKESDNRSSYFLFSNNCSEKEDFYHALLLNQYKSSSDEVRCPQPQLFETEHMIKLIRQLHASEDNVQTRWLNALTGRIFLALYKTSHVEELVKAKIRKKISRVAKPTFISSLSLKEIELGDSAPTFVRLRLKEMGVDGALTLETDVKYTGQFKAVIAATARIDLGQRFKPREVDLVLAGILKRLEGHLLIHIKPPPSNRVWMSFETMPKVQLSLEPIVSSRQITFGYILTAIERKIIEVISDTIVFPNWDDIAFLDTVEDDYRGGIWTASSKSQMPTSESSSSVTLEDISTPSIDTSKVNVNGAVSTTHGSDTTLNADVHQSTSLDIGPDGPVTTISAASHDAPVADGADGPGAIALDVDARSTSHSFPTAVQEVIEIHHASADKINLPFGRSTSDENPPSMSASSSFTEARTQDMESGDTVHARDTDMSAASDKSSYAVVQKQERAAFEDTLLTEAQTDRAEQGSSTSSSPLNKKILTATTAARKWGTDFLQRQHDGVIRSDNPGRLQDPIGRGSLLPPPGQPLPGPASKPWSTSALNSIKRKSFSTSSLSSKESSSTGK